MTHASSFWMLLIRRFFFCFFFLTLFSDTSVHASDEPEFVITTSAPSAASVPSSSSVSNTFSPSISAQPSVSAQPSDPPITNKEVCSNTPGFTVTEWNKFYREWHLQTLGCDDILVDCYEFGNLGQVRDHCCKCRNECEGQCNETVFTEPSTNDDADDKMDQYSTGFFSLFVPMALLIGICILFRLYVLRKRERRIAREAMILRRLDQERRENNNGLTDEENANLRFEQFVTKFYFQKVSADKSNISAESIRKSCTTKDEETPTEKSISFDEGEQSPSGDHANNNNDIDKEQSPTAAAAADNTISEQLSSWMFPSAAKHHECCICLDTYSTGETICAPAIKSCNHVFHESCIKEWIKKSDQCPLCRVNLLKD